MLFGSFFPLSFSVKTHRQNYYSYRTETLHFFYGFLVLMSTGLLRHCNAGNTNIYTAPHLASHSVIFWRPFFICQCVSEKYKEVYKWRDTTAQEECAGQTS